MEITAGGVSMEWARRRTRDCPMRTGNGNLHAVAMKTATIPVVPVARIIQSTGGTGCQDYEKDGILFESIRGI